MPTKIPFVNYKIGDTVIRHANPNFKVNGRIGIILDINHANDKIQVQWLYEKDGSLIIKSVRNCKDRLSVKTWVYARDIRPSILDCHTNIFSGTSGSIN